MRRFSSVLSKTRSKVRAMLRLFGAFSLRKKSPLLPQICSHRLSPALPSRSKLGREFLASFSVIIPSLFSLSRLALPAPAKSLSSTVLISSKLEICFIPAGFARLVASFAHHLCGAVPSEQGRVSSLSMRFFIILARALGSLSQLVPLRSKKYSSMLYFSISFV